MTDYILDMHQIQRILDKPLPGFFISPLKSISVPLISLVQAVKVEDPILLPHLAWVLSVAEAGIESVIGGTHQRGVAPVRNVPFWAPDQVLGE